MTTERPLDYGELVEVVLNCVRGEGREFDLEISEYSDTYYDDVEGRISEGGSSIRLRSYVDGRYEMTIKKPVSEKEGLFSREEVNMEPDPEDLDGSLIKFVESAFPRHGSHISPVLNVETTRNEVFLKESKFTICIDRCRSRRPSLYAESEFFYEMEFEAIDSDLSKDSLISRIQEMIARRFSFIPSPSSKYVRGMEWVRSTGDCPV